jgi:hypothetical protein
VGQGRHSGNGDSAVTTLTAPANWRARIRAHRIFFIALFSSDEFCSGVCRNIDISLAATGLLAVEMPKDFRISEQCRRLPPMV